MTKKLDKELFIKALADKCDYTIKDTKKFLDNLIDFFGECVLNEIEIDVRGFGKLYYQIIPERDGFKPIKGKKGEGVKMHYPETTRVIFKLAKNLRDFAKYEIDDEINEEAQ